MPVPPVLPVPPVRPVRPGAASMALRPLLTGPPTDGRVAGVHPACVYVLVAGSVVALEAADGLGLPCAVRLGADRRTGPFVHVRQGDPATVGAGTLRAGPLTVRVARWWAPARSRPLVSPGRTRDRARLLARLLAAHPAPVPVDAPVGELLGLGPGLTPAGDDVVAGLLLALHHHADLRDAFAAEVSRLAADRTTALSAALLGHAAAGRAVPAAVALADALAGHGPDALVEPALRRLLAVGSSSGNALAHGLLRGARTVTAGRRREAAA